MVHMSISHTVQLCSWLVIYQSFFIHLAFLSQWPRLPAIRWFICIPDLWFHWLFQVVFLFLHSKTTLFHWNCDFMLMTPRQKGHRPWSDRLPVRDRLGRWRANGLWIARWRVGRIKVRCWTRQVSGLFLCCKSPPQFHFQSWWRSNWWLFIDYKW